MGYLDRDYVRNDTDRSSYGSMGDTTRMIIIATVIVFLLQGFGTSRVRAIDSVTLWLGMIPELVLQGQVWRLVTFVFCHDVTNIMHILFNMFFLWQLGGLVEAHLGRREYVAFYLAAGLASGLTCLGVYLATSIQSVTIGASGSVLALAMIYAKLNPDVTFYVFFCIPVKGRWLPLVLLAFDVLPVLGIGTSLAVGVSHAAHIGGMVFGLLYFRYNWRLTSFLTGMSVSRMSRAFRRRPRGVRVYRGDDDSPEPIKTVSPLGRESTVMGHRGTSATAGNTRSSPGIEELSARVDELLAKISVTGEASLTESEREELRHAAEAFKQRKNHG